MGPKEPFWNSTYSISVGLGGDERDSIGAGNNAIGSLGVGVLRCCADAERIESDLDGAGVSSLNNRSTTVAERGRLDASCERLRVAGVAIGVLATWSIGI